MKLHEFKELNSRAPVVAESQLQIVTILKYVSQIDLERAIPAIGMSQARSSKPFYADITVGDCDMGLLLDGTYLWGAYRCLGECVFSGSWCWLMLSPMTFGSYSSEARACYYRDNNNELWQACAHHSLTMDVAIYTFWHELEAGRFTISAKLSRSR